MSVPTGPVQSPAPWGRVDLDWSEITQFDAFIHEAADPLGWAIERIRAHILIESTGNPDAVQRNASNGDSFGLMQIVPYGVGWDGWYRLIERKAGLPKNAKRKDVIDALYDPRINIIVGVNILEEFWLQHGSADKASSAFFLGNPHWRGEDTVNGNTGRDYQRSLNALIEEQQNFAPPIGVDPITIILRRTAYTAEYGFKSPTSLPYYAYFEGHGGTRWQHTGIDVPGTRHESLHTPGAGIVTCVGQARGGSGSWNTGCSAFPDQDGGGVGRVEILLDTGVSLILGHCAAATVRLGERVVAGQQVATMGGMNGTHVHIETRVWREDANTYWIIDPYKALNADTAWPDGGKPPPRPPDPPIYVERFPVPQPGEFETWWTVEAVEDGVPVLQRASLESAEVRWPMEKGETTEVVYLTIGNDGAFYWVSRLGSRIPVAGTRAEGISFS